MISRSRDHGNDEWTDLDTLIGSELKHGDSLLLGTEEGRSEMAPVSEEGHGRDGREHTSGGDSDGDEVSVDCKSRSKKRE